MSTKRKSSKKDNEDGKMLVDLLKNSKIFNNSDDGSPMWRIKITDIPETISFADSKNLDFMGYSFVKKEKDKKNDKIFLNPPKEIVYLLSKDKKRLVKNEEKISKFEEQYGQDVFYGYYKIGSEKKVSIEKVIEDIELDDADLNRGDMRAWSLRKVAEYLLQEVPSHEALLACLTSQIQHISYIDNNAISEIADVLKTIRSKPSERKHIDVEEEEDITENLKKNEELKKYEKMLKNPENSDDKNSKIEKHIKKIKTELKMSFGNSSLQSNRGQPRQKKIRLSKRRSKKRLNLRLIGQSRIQTLTLMKNYSNENLPKNLPKNLQKSLKKSLKKNKKTTKLFYQNSKKENLKILILKKPSLILMTPTPISNKKYLNLKMIRRRSIRNKRRSNKRRSNKRRSNKRRSNKRRSNKVRKNKQRSFGSIYGLQGSNISYSGLYPMEMNFKGTMPNLLNVKRSYNAA
jgi:hypothetical protein